MSKVALSQYWDMLSQFDWFYAWSDSMRVYRAGEVAEEALKALTGLGAEYADLYARFRAHKYSGAPFGKPEAPKPPRPTE